MARLPKPPATNDNNAMVQLTKLHLTDRTLNVAIPFAPIHIQTQSPEEEVSVASAHNVTLERVRQVPYVYGADVRVSATESIVSRLLVARDNLVIHANRIEADGLLASGDVEINCPQIRITRVSGFSYSFFNRQPIPAWALQAFKYRRYGHGLAHRQAFVDKTHIPANSVVTENVVCGSDLTIGGLSTIHGAVKVYGSVKVEERVVFLGPVVVNGDFHAPAGCVFMSDVVIKGEMKIGGLLVAGQPLRHSVCVVARQLELSGSVIGSGTLVASEQEGLNYAA